VIAQLHQNGFALEALCRTLGASRSSYYAHQQGSLSRRAREDQRLKALIETIFWDHQRRYGARRIAQELAERNECCGVRRVARLLEEMGLHAIQPKAHRPRTTESRHRLGYSPNLLLENPSPSGINQVWLGDISYVPLLAGGFVYQALLMDLYSRRIVGWELRNCLKESLVLAALKSAIARRCPPIDLIHHTDRGGQYAGRAYRQVLARARMRQSMSRAANVYDNAFMESCFGTIKRELEMAPYASESAARAEIGGYLRYYNRRRRHSSLGYLMPAQFEAAVREPADHGGEKHHEVARNKMENPTEPKPGMRCSGWREPSEGLAGRSPSP
jgi:transposase InsO family protein